MLTGKQQLLCAPQVKSEITRESQGLDEHRIIDPKSRRNRISDQIEETRLKNLCVFDSEEQTSHTIVLVTLCERELSGIGCMRRHPRHNLLPHSLRCMPWNFL